MLAVGILFIGVFLLICYFIPIGMALGVNVDATKGMGADPPGVGMEVLVMICVVLIAAIIYEYHYDDVIRLWESM